MNQENKLPAGPLLFLVAYSKLLNCANKGDTSSKALKGYGLLNAIAWFQASGESVSAPRLAEYLGVTPTGVRHPLDYLKRLELVEVVEHREHFKKWHELLVPQPMVDFLKEVQRVIGDPEGAHVEGSNIGLLIHHISCQIRERRRASETPTCALQAIGFFIFLARLNAQFGPVTRAKLAKCLNMHPNSFKGKLDYLQHLGLITVRAVRADNHPGREEHISAGEAIVAEFRHWDQRLQQDTELRDCCEDKETFRCRKRGVA